MDRSDVVEIDGLDELAAIDKEYKQINNISSIKKESESHG